MIFPSTKEHTMKRIATAAFAVLLVSLLLASVASAHRAARVHAPLIHHHRLAI